MQEVLVAFQAYETHFYGLQCLAFSSSVICLWPDDGLVIEAETCCHLVTLNKITIHNTSCVLTCESLLLTCMHPKISFFFLFHVSGVLNWHRSLLSRIISCSNSRASYSGGPGLRSQPRDRLSLPTVSMFLLVPFYRKNAVQCTRGTPWQRPEVLTAPLNKLIHT